MSAASATEIGLGAFLLIGALYDIFRRRIPNWLNLAGLVVAGGAGFLQSGVSALGDASLGLAVGLLLPLPLYAFASMGAGDVKMMAVVGAFVGPGKIAAIVPASVLVGGLLALTIMLLRGELGATLGRYRTMLAHLLVAREIAYLPPRPGDWAARRMAFAPAVAIGTLLVAAWQAHWLPDWVYSVGYW